MSISELLNEFIQRKEAVAEFKRELNALQRKKAADEIALDREVRDVAIALLKAVGIDLTEHDFEKMLGAAAEMADRLQSGRDDDRLRKRGKEFEERFANAFAEVKAGPRHTDPITIDEGLLVDPHATSPVDLFVVLQKNPVETSPNGDATSDRSTRDQIDAVASHLGLKRYTHISSRNPVCVLVGKVKPTDIARFVDEHDGVMLRNNSGGTFKGPNPARKTPPSNSPKEVSETRTAAAPSDKATASKPDQMADDQSGAAVEGVGAAPETDTAVPDDGKEPASNPPTRFEPGKPVRMSMFKNGPLQAASTGADPKKDTSQPGGGREDRKADGDDALTADGDDRHENGGQS
jgi:hypothetical protein